MTAEEAIERFVEKADAGQATNLKNGRQGTIPPATRDSIISSVRAAYRRASGTSDLSRVEHAPLATILEAAVVADAREHGRTHPHNEANRVRRFLATLEGDRAKPGRRTQTVLGPWRPLHELSRLVGQPRHAGHSIRRIAQAALLQGQVHRPENLPTDRNLVLRWLRLDGAGKEKAAAYVRWYDRLRELSPARESLPDLSMTPFSERGIRGLSDLAQRLEAAGSTESPRTLSVEETLALVAPGAHDVLRSYLQDPTEIGRHRGHAWRKQARGALSRWMAALIRNPAVLEHLAQQGLDERTVRPIDLVLLEMPHRRIEAVGRGDWEARYLTNAHGEAMTIQEPLFRVLAEDMALESARRSPLEVRNTANSATLYTETLLQDIAQLRFLAEHDGSRKLFVIQPELSEVVFTRISAFRKHANKRNKSLGIGGRKKKEKVLLQVTLPQLAAIGLPALARRVAELEDQYWIASSRHGPDHTATRRARRSYYKAEREYVVLALVLEDGMRVGNYAGARVGTPEVRHEWVGSESPDGVAVRSRVHVIPDLDRSEDGTARGFRRLEVGFYGDDHPAPRLKIETRDGNPRTRSNTLHGWILDLDRLWAYFSGQRVDDLVAQRILASREDYDIERDLREWHYALITSPVRSVKDPYSRVTGSAGQGVHRDAFSRALLWCAREALGRKLPEDEAELRRQFRSLFGPHIGRLLLGTYFHGIRGMTTYVMGLIDDTRQMIERRYSVTEPSLLNLRGWEEVRFLDPLVDRAREQGRPLSLEATRRFFEEQSIPPDAWPPALL
jgi:hypothetical protein